MNEKEESTTKIKVASRLILMLPSLEVLEIRSR